MTRVLYTCEEYIKYNTDIYPFRFNFYDEALRSQYILLSRPKTGLGFSIEFGPHAYNFGWTVVW